MNASSSSLFRSATMLLALLLLTLPVRADEHEHLFANGFCACGEYQAATVIDGGCEIANAGQLYWFAAQVNGGSTGLNATLTADITVNTDVLDANGNLSSTGGSFRDWTPIGRNNKGQSYAGTFDGNGHTVSGLYLDNYEQEEDSYSGLFGATASSAVVKDLELKDSYFRSYDAVGGLCVWNNGTIADCISAASCYAKTNAGGVASRNRGTLVRCLNEGKISGGEHVGGVCGVNDDEISYCRNEGKILGSGWYIGGLCGSNYATLSYCGNSGTIPSGANCIGGLCGQSMKGYIDHSYNEASIGVETSGNGSGGICGDNYQTTIVHCYNTGSIASRQTCGGICGKNQDGTVSHCFNVGNTESYYTPGGICGDNGGSVSTCFYLNTSTGQGAGEGSENGTEGVSAERFASGEITWLLNDSCSAGELSWYQDLAYDDYPSLNNDHRVVYPGKDICHDFYTNNPLIHEYDNGFCRFCDTYEPAVLDEADGYYAIANAGQLYWFAGLVNGTLTGVPRDAMANGKLTANITVNEHVHTAEGELCDAELREWKPMVLQGTFDGQNHTVGGLYRNKPSESSIAFVENTLETGVILNVGIVDTYFVGYRNIAGVCAFSHLLVRNCYFEGTLQGNGYVGGICASGTLIEDCHNAGWITGITMVGGICAWNATIRHCYNTGSIWMTENDDYSGAGGICGYNSRGRTIEHCYNAGYIKTMGDYASIGGIVGSSDDHVVNCFNTGTIDDYGSNSKVGGICGFLGSNRDDYVCRITDCYNTGRILDSKEAYTKVGAICGLCSSYNGSYSGEVVNSYYLTGTCHQGVGYGLQSAQDLSSAQFESGEAAWRLNHSEAGENPAWRQTLNQDNSPVLEASHGIVVKATTNGLNSIVRPTAGALVGATAVYNFAGILGTEVYGIEYTEPLIAAGHPYVYTSDQAYLNFTPSDQVVIDDTDTHGLTSVLNPEGQTVYGQGNTAGQPVSLVFTASALKYAHPNGNLVKYGKAYVNAQDAFLTTASLMVSPLPVRFEEMSTGLDGLDADEPEGRAYNLMGQEVGDDYRGLVLRNGKKTLRK